MASRKTRRKNLIQLLSLVIAVVVVVLCSIAFQSWWNNRPGPEPNTVTITASSGDVSQDITPFSVCEPGVPCDENEVPSIAVDKDGELKISVPKEVSDHDWSLLKIYDDPAANDQSFFGANEATEATVAGSVDPVRKKDDKRPRLVVAEVTSVLIGHDDQGVETPYTVTWSVSAK